MVHDIRDGTGGLDGILESTRFSRLAIVIIEIILAYLTTHATSSPTPELSPKSRITIRKSEKFALSGNRQPRVWSGTCEPIVQATTASLTVWVPNPRWPELRCSDIDPSTSYPRLSMQPTSVHERLHAHTRQHDVFKSAPRVYRSVPVISPVLDFSPGLLMLNHAVFRNDAFQPRAVFSPSRCIVRPPFFPSPRMDLIDQRQSEVKKQCIASHPRRAPLLPDPISY